MNKKTYFLGYYAKRSLGFMTLVQRVRLSRQTYQTGLSSGSPSVTDNQRAADTFQENKSLTVKQRIFAQIKQADGLSMRTLLKTRKPGWNPASTPLLTVTDLGGGDGDMLDQLLPLAKQFDLHVNEPNDTLRSAYWDKTQQPAYQSTLRSVSSASLKMEDPTYQIPASDLVLASHSLYYTVDQWKKPLNTIADIKTHFLYKLTAALKQDGVLCVILQSKAAPGKHHTGANLAALEAFAYPLMGRDTKNCVTADTFEEALEAYNAFLKHSSSYSPLLWQTAPPSVCSITMGDLNFSPDPNNGRYDQAPTVTELLNFYTRNEYGQWPGKKQRQFLDWLQHHCQTPSGSCVVTHVNQVMAIMRQPTDVTQIDRPSPGIYS